MNSDFYFTPIISAYYIELLQDVPGLSFSRFCRLRVAPGNPAYNIKLEVLVDLASLGKAGWFQSCQRDNTMI